MASSLCVLKPSRQTGRRVLPVASLPATGKQWPIGLRPAPRYGFPTTLRSFATDFLIMTLYRSVTLQPLHEVLEVHGGFIRPFVERGKIPRVLSEFIADRVVDELGDRP